MISYNNLWRKKSLVKTVQESAYFYYTFSVN